jgi:hypothetical protein
MQNGLDTVGERLPSVEPRRTDSFALGNLRLRPMVIENRLTTLLDRRGGLKQCA